MFFKSIYAFKLNEKEISEKDLLAKLENFRIVPCGKNDKSSVGWTDVLDEEESLCFKVGKSAYILNLKFEEKNIPASYVQEELKKKIKTIVKEGGEWPNKKEMKVMKEDIIQELIPRAFAKVSSINGYLDFANQLLVIDASSPGKADKFNGFLRESLGSLDIDIINPENDVSITMGNWIKEGKSVRPFEIGDNCLLKEQSGDASKITVANHDLTVEEITQHLDNGKIVEKMDLVWQKRVSFSVNSAFRISKVKFLDIVQEQLNEEMGESDDNYALMQASMQIMIGDFAEIINDVVKAFSE